ncbi:hypothetical protein ACHAC9_03290 [Massilia sp. CMS3.1]|uniref:pilus assembly PilX family protein n=1 Tax=Massilia sp. CMS3.1 TaxID=3373083 RepID=UPI003EE6ED7D
MNRSFHRSEQGIALPVMLIILLVMLISSVYLLKSSNTTTLTAANLAYDSAQGRAVDAGLHQGFEWLSDTAKTNRALLNENSSANGYVAILMAGQSVRSEAFWEGGRVVEVNQQRIEYVIHRLCSLKLPYDHKDNACVLTSDNPSAMGSSVKVGDSLALDAPRFTTIPKVHYVVTARIAGARGGNVVNQLVVQIGA